MIQLEASFKSAPSSAPRNIHDILALTSQIVEEFTALWGYSGMLAETVAEEGMTINKKRLQWCSKKLEEYCLRLSEEVVVVKNMLEESANSVS